MVRAFANAEVPHPEDRVDPVADAEAVDLELAIADREQTARRLERVRKGARVGEAGAVAELASLEPLVEALDAGRPARLVDDEAAQALAADMGLLTAKPVLYIANTDEELEPPEGLVAHAPAQGAQALALPVGMELELAAMDPEEAAELAAELELGDVRGADAVVAAAYRLLDLVTFFTGSGPPEARAWPIRRGTTAAGAAGTHPLGPGARLHPRRGDRLGGPRGRRLVEQGARGRPAAHGGQGLRGAGGRRDPGALQRLSDGAAALRRGGPGTVRSRRDHRRRPARPRPADRRVVDHPRGGRPARWPASSSAASADASPCWCSA